jgi:hypothetical protein
MFILRKKLATIFFSEGMVFFLEKTFFLLSANIGMNDNQLENNTKNST